ncbi:MAG: hypothetical protein ACRDLF_00600 [Solirubrobacteraceae bacterium]
MPSAIDTRTSPWGSPIPTSVIEDFIKTAVRHDALADFVYEYVFESLDADGEPPAELGEALRVAFMEVIETSATDHWDRVGRALVADARDCLEPPPEIDSAEATTTSRPVARAAAPRRGGRREYREDGPHARSRRNTASRLIEAYEHLRRQSPDGNFKNAQLLTQANLAVETLFQQFGRTGGLRWATDATAAIRLPALWAELGMVEPGAPLDQVRAAGKEYLRLALAHPAAMRTLVQPEELDELLRPKDPRRYRTLQELTAALARRAAEQDRLIEQALLAATRHESAETINVPEMVGALRAAWLRVAVAAWHLGGKPNDEALFQKIAASTDAILSAPPTASPA